IYCNDPTYNILWTHDGYNAGPVGGVNPTPVAPHSTTNYPVVMTNGTITCRDTVRIVVVNPIVQVNAGNDTVVCTGQCATLSATAKVIKNPAKTPTYRNLQPDTAAITSFGGIITQGANVNINITTLNMTNVLPGSIVSVCIDRIRMTGLGLGAGNLQFYLLCPDGTSIVLMPDSTATGNAGLFGYNTLFNQTCFYPAGPAVSSGTPPYTNSFGTSESFDNLAGCTANGVWTLAVVPQSGFGSGTIVTSGWSITFNDPEIAYTGDFTWTPTTGMTNSTTLNPTVCPPPTAYTLTVSDTAGCVTQSDVVNVTTQACCALSASATRVQPTCGQSNGSINITPVPAGTYTYAWSDGPSTLQNRTGLAAGTYTVTITSTVTPTCTFDTTIILNSSGSLSVSFSNQVNPTCAGNDGSITVTLAGGTPVYAITIDTGGAPFTINSPIAGSQNIPGLDAGTVTVSVVDGGSCTASATATIVAPSNCCTVTATSTTTQPTCGQSNGAINITPNPAGSYNYAWSDGPSTLQNRTGLAAGTYSVTVTNSAVSTCTFTTTVTLNSNSSLTLAFSNQVNPSCGANDGSLTATLAGGTAPYTITIDTGAGPFTVNSPIPGSVNLPNLHAGTVTASVVDGAGCTASATATLAAPNSPTLTFSNPVNPTCAGNNGSVTATLAGGTGPYVITVDTGSGPFTLNSPIAGSINIPGLHAGTVTASVSDANSCTANATVTLTAATNCCTHTLSAALVQPTCGQADGSITLTTSNGSGNYTYAWGGGETIPVLNNIGAGNYSVTITDNGFANCFIDTAFALTNPNGPVIDSFKILNVSCAGNGSDGS
ncbi:MAG TPA: SprB repeat-containing protein, partial [Chitinophagales bacterium]|nr:SprB repeat-containing protein [Chitinophagales bacterium]